MTLKWIGAIVIFVACAWCGYAIATSQKREEAILRQLRSALEHMEWELQYRMTPLPELCRVGAIQSQGELRKFWNLLSAELDSQVAPDVSRCIDVALAQSRKLPESVAELLQLLGKSLGKFDLYGQLSGFQAINTDCQRKIEKLCENKDTRLRSFQTLGLCAGAALAILFI